MLHELEHQADGGLLQAHPIELDQFGVRQFPGGRKARDNGPNSVSQKYRTLDDTKIAECHFVQSGLRAQSTSSSEQKCVTGVKA
jgi:hypothetical protein